MNLLTSFSPYSLAMHYFSEYYLLYPGYQIFTFRQLQGTDCSCTILPNREQWNCLPLPHASRRLRLYREWHHLHKAFQSCISASHLPKSFAYFIHYPTTIHIKRSSTQSTLITPMFVISIDLWSTKTVCQGRAAEFFCQQQQTGATNWYNKKEHQYTHIRVERI